MLPGEPNTPPSKLRKFRPQAKLPPATLLQAFAPAEVRILKRLVNDGVEYVHDDFLELPHAAQLVAQPLFSDGRPTPGNDDSGMYSLDAGAPLNRERYLFLRLNYCRRQVMQILSGQAKRRLDLETTRELLRWERAAMEVRGEIARENVPLVLAMAKRTHILGVDLTDLISEGNLALLRAVNKFDSARGYKFSTYACRAILKSFSRVAARMARHRGHFPTEFDPSLEKSDFVERTRVETEGRCVQELRSILVENLANLSDVEQKVILARFAINQEPEGDLPKPATLEQVGQMIGVTKERVRQIQNKALGKLKTALEQAVLS
ncbi:MAG: sigma-70 family RNA polymerase sigma factor [Planctomycetota bacterium]